MFTPALFRWRPVLLFSLVLTWLVAHPVAHARAAEKSRADAPHVPSGYALRTWQERAGLPDDELQGVTQDAEGYLWVIDKTSFARFDGSNFLPLNAPDAITLRGYAAVAANSTDTGQLALPANRGSDRQEAGLYLITETTATFVVEPQLAGKIPRTIFYASDGRRWIGCEDGTLLSRQGDHVTRLDDLAQRPSRRPPAFATDADGTTWVTWDNRVYRLTADRCEEIALAQPEPEIRLVSSRTGPVWLISRTALWRASADARNFIKIRALPDELGAHFLQAALEDHHGMLWLGTRSRGLFRLGEGEPMHVGTSSDDISGICEDAQGSLWVATDSGGLNRLRPQAHQLFDRERGLFDNYSYTVAADRQGDVWLANRDGGVARVRDTVVDPIARRAGWRSFSARSVYPANDGGVWITSGLGVFRTEAANPDVIQRIPELGLQRNVRATFVARNGDYWLGLDPDRVGRFRDGKLTVFGPEQGFDGREIRALAEDAEGRIWLGAMNGALFRATPTGFERVPFPESADVGAIQVIYFEPTGRMLLGTTRHGVLLFPPGNFTDYRRLNRHSGLPHSNVSQLLIDDHDRYWFATRNGIFWANGEQVRALAEGRADFVHTIMLGADDGVPPLACLGLYQPAAWKTPDGTLWFATRRGVLRTDPDIIAHRRDPLPPARVTHLSIDDRPHPVSAEVTIDPVVRKLQLGLSVLNLATPESVQLRVRLEGFDEAWTTVGRDFALTYPRLPPGRYPLAAMVSNGGAEWLRQPNLLTFIVPTPWWQTLWFRLTVAATVLTALALVIRARSHRRLQLLLRKAEHARAIERERTRIARDIHDDIGATLTRISLLTQFSSQDPQRLRELLAKIHDSTRSVTRSLDEIVWAVNPRHDNLESLIYYFSNYAREYLGAAGIRCRLEAPNPPPPLLVESQIRHGLFLCSREALHNVVKHAGATEVTISFTATPHAITLAIADDGRGLTSPAPGKPDPSRIAAGNGLTNLHQHMTDLGGECHFAANPTGGTRVEFRVPLNHTPANENPPRAH